ncbi:MAG: ATP synthase subunit I [Gammaproteobacteria bacterium]|nr:MAG: ATP synthase subunit I [Gammaproteobacteria bacterium]
MTDAVTDTAARKIARAARRVAALQLAAGAVVAAGFFVVRGPEAALAAGYGAAVALLLTWLQGRDVSRAAEAARGVAREGKGRSLRILYIGAAVRFFLALGLFAAGPWLLGLPPLGMVAAFAAAQLVYLLRARAPG